MPSSSLVRWGAFGQVGRFLHLSGEPYPRGVRVVCRTRRGLEIGEVLAPANSLLDSPPLENEPADSPPTADGELIRRVTPADDLLLVRLEQRREAAIAGCERLLAERGLAVSLVEVEQTFDGKSLVFYFLGEMSPMIDDVTAELAAAYEQTVQLKQFAELLEHGCGPDCGTENAEGCGTGCSSCAVACGIKRA